MRTRHHHASGSLTIDMMDEMRQCLELPDEPFPVDALKDAARSLIANPDHFGWMIIASAVRSAALILAEGTARRLVGQFSEDGTMIARPQGAAQFLAITHLGIYAHALADVEFLIRKYKLPRVTPKNEAGSLEDFL